MNESTIEPHNETEGVTKYQLSFTRGPALAARDIAQLIHWHRRLHTRGLIGRDSERYGGLAFGNLSQRLAGGGFAISGTQTGDISAPTAEHFAQVTAWNCGDNQVTANGPAQPSSESLTHAALYDADPIIRYIFHVHTPEIWQQRQSLDLPTTDESVAYGTPAMADEVIRLYRSAGFTGTGVIAMGGHQDGVISFGHDAEQAGRGLLDLLG